jgi:hypothetical protein
MKKVLSLSLILILLVTACKKDKGDPPVHPPAESMTIDFSNFDNQQAKTATFTKGTENSNWFTAAGIAATWKIIIGTTLIVPVTAFRTAIDQTPVFVSEKTWQWTYNATVASATYHAKLTGVIGGTDVSWKMQITKDNAYTDFVWFEGTSKIDGTGGQWILYESNANPVKVLQIDWTKTGNSVGTVKYTYIKTGETFNGSYIEYGLTTNTPYNAYYRIHYYNLNSANASKFSDFDVEWSTTNHNGRLKSSDYLLGTWFCWNEQKINATCQ